MASNGDGMWSEFATSATLVLEPAFYQTTWFYALCVAVVLVFLWLGYLIRVRHLSARLGERLEWRANERVRIARDLHDTLLQAIHGLMLRFHYATESLSENEPVREMLQKALSRADSVLIEGRERVQSLRGDPTESDDFPQRMWAIGRELLSDSPIEFRVIVEGRSQSLQAAIRDEVFSIAREALTNAVAHAKATTIEVEISFGGKELCVRCKDNGVGIAPDILRVGGCAGHWGLVGMQERATSIRAQLHVWSSSGKGTEVKLSVSAARAYVGVASRYERFKQILYFRWLIAKDKGGLSEHRE